MCVCVCECARATNNQCSTVQLGKYSPIMLGIKKCEFFFDNINAVFIYLCWRFE